MFYHRLTELVKRHLPPIRLEHLTQLVTLTSGLVSILATITVLRGPHA